MVCNIIMNRSKTTFITAVIGLLSIFVAAQDSVADTGPASSTCTDYSIAAGALHTQKDVQAFVQCAHEYVQSVGIQEARRAFHQDAHWKSGQVYVFVNETGSTGGRPISLVFPPDPAREGTPWELVIDNFGSDVLDEIDRVVSSAGEGWVYYAYTNPETGATEPKISYVKEIQWNGAPAVIGAGIYRSDLPGTCGTGEVNATWLAGNPSAERLKQFVTCAVMELELRGYYAVSSLTSDPRWRNGMTYIFALDTHGNHLFSGDPFGHRSVVSELSGVRTGSTADRYRDLVPVADTFGETFLYYPKLNSLAGEVQNKVAFVKRAVVYGLPILIGSGYFLNALPAQPGEGQGGEPGESGTQYGLSDTARETRAGVELVIRYDSARERFTGTVRNTTNQPVRLVRVEVHLANGVELGPTPTVDLAPGQVRTVTLDATSQTFDRFSVHVEIGPGEHGGGEGGREGGGESGGEGGREGSGEGGEGGEHGRREGGSR